MLWYSARFCVILHSFCAVLDAFLSQSDTATLK